MYILDHHFRPVNRSSSVSYTHLDVYKRQVQDRVWVEEHHKSYDAYFRCTLPTYAICNLAVVQTFYNKVKMTLGINNIFNYIPHTLGSGITMFNVPATCGARGYVQMEFLVDDIVKSLKRKK